MRKIFIIFLYTVAGILVGLFIRRNIFTLIDTVSEKYDAIIYTLAPVVVIMCFIIGIKIGIERSRDKEKKINNIKSATDMQDSSDVRTLITKEFKPSKTLYFITYTIAAFILSFGLFISFIGLMGTIWHIIVGFIIVMIGYLLMKLAKRFKN